MTILSGPGMLAGRDGTCCRVLSDGAVDCSRSRRARSLLSMLLMSIVTRPSSTSASRVVGPAVCESASACGSKGGGGSTVEPCSCSLTSYVGGRFFVDILNTRSCRFLPSQLNAACRDVSIVQDMEWKRIMILLSLPFWGPRC
jgi:hypothetical protein